MQGPVKLLSVFLAERLRVENQFCEVCAQRCTIVFIPDADIVTEAERMMLRASGRCFGDDRRTIDQQNKLAFGHGEHQTLPCIHHNGGICGERCAVLQRDLVFAAADLEREAVRAEFEMAGVSRAGIEGERHIGRAAGNRADLHRIVKAVEPDERTALNRAGQNGRLFAVAAVGHGLRILLDRMRRRDHSVLAAAGIGPDGKMAVGHLRLLRGENDGGRFLLRQIERCRCCRRKFGFRRTEDLCLQNAQ